jgi:hypothetical protein
MKVTPPRRYADKRDVKLIVPHVAC